MTVTGFGLADEIYTLPDTEQEESKVRHISINKVYLIVVILCITKILRF